MSNHTVDSHADTLIYKAMGDKEDIFSDVHCHRPLIVAINVESTPKKEQ
ncbi:hypothetical protein JCM19233_6976 [Vibrio astriarenae]|nr:hypothetical protein JCM19233_6976 [Vibrio sp. C7]